MGHEGVGRDTGRFWTQVMGVLTKTDYKNKIFERIICTRAKKAVPLHRKGRETNYKTQITK